MYEISQKCIECHFLRNFRQTLEGFDSFPTENAMDAPSILPHVNYTEVINTNLLSLPVITHH